MKIKIEAKNGLVFKLVYEDGTDFIDGVFWAIKDMGAPYLDPEIAVKLVERWNSFEKFLSIPAKIELRKTKR